MLAIEELTSEQLWKRPRILNDHKLKLGESSDELVQNLKSGGFFKYQIM